MNPLSPRRHLPVRARAAARRGRLCLPTAPVGSGLFGSRSRVRGACDAAPVPAHARATPRPEQSEMGARKKGANGLRGGWLAGWCQDGNGTAGNLPSPSLASRLVSSWLPRWPAGLHRRSAAQAITRACAEHGREEAEASPIPAAGAVCRWASLAAPRLAFSLAGHHATVARDAAPARSPHHPFIHDFPTRVERSCG